MKKLIFNPNLFEIEITDPKFITMVIENKSYYWRFSRYLYDSFPDHIKYCTVLNNGNELEVEDLSLYISNLLDLNLNTKQNLNALYKILKKSYFEELSEAVAHIEEQLTNICKEIKLDFDAELTMNGSIKVDDVFKIGGIQFQEGDSTFIEQLSRFILVAKELRNISIVFVNHLHDYLSDEEISNLVKEIQYKGITLVNIETTTPNSITENEKIAIVDSDFCGLA